MKRFEFDKIILESPIPPQDINMLWIDIDENTQKIKWIKEFDKISQSWKTILDNDYDNQEDKEVTITQNNTIAILPSIGYNALKKVTVTTVIPAEKAIFATLRDFADNLTILSGFTEEMNTPVTDYIHDKRFPVKIESGTTSTVFYGTLVSAYDNTNSYQEVFYTDNSQIKKYKRTYNTSTHTWSNFVKQS